MSGKNDILLVINAGSSSIKAAAFSCAPEPTEVSKVAIENIGQDTCQLISDGSTKPITAADHAAATKIILAALQKQVAGARIRTVGHRVVHGGPHYHEPAIIDAAMLTQLHRLSSFDPQHLPAELGIIAVIQKLIPDVPQIACFDTAFHHALPTTARLLPVPRRLEAAGVRRYGFHGLSYASIVAELRSVEGEAAANGNVIIAHLGSGASLAALQQGASIDTTMGLTPASGIPMSTRAGDLDPGLPYYLSRTQNYDPKTFDKMVNFESGLLGISGTTADMKTLLEIESTDQRAKDAVDIFCYYVKKQIGAYAAALGGLHTLVFTGGMGENAPKIRARVCNGLEFLGVHMDPGRNERGERLVTADGSPVGVHVIHTDEALTIARETAQLIGTKHKGNA